jgi:hypothetical protein
MWLFPGDDDGIASLRLWDITQADDEHPYGKRVKCPGLDGRFLNRGDTIQLTIPRTCIADPARIRVNGKLWDVTRYNRNTGFPRKGHFDGVPRADGYTGAL